MEFTPLEQIHHVVTDGHNARLLQVGTIQLASQKYESDYKFYFDCEQFDLPASHYAPAKISYSIAMSAINKYSYQPLEIVTSQELFELLCQKCEYNFTPAKLELMVTEMMNDWFKGIEFFLNPLSDDRVIRLMTHDLNDQLRAETSCGIGFNIKRKALARNFEGSIRKFLNSGCPDFEIYWKTFLKDEIRLITKETRSIAVPQVHLWLIAMKYLGGLYDYFKATVAKGHHGFGISDDSYEWTELFSRFDPNETVYCYDIRKQDSRMSAAFIRFLHEWLISKTPIISHQYIHWFFEESFYNKKVVIPNGNVFTFSNGEMSGNPLTILINTLHNCFIAINAQIKNFVKYGNRIELTKGFIATGDDSIFQSIDGDSYKDVAAILGHEVTNDKGNLFNDQEFLSYKFNKFGFFIEPYYANMDKMFASLRYTTKNHFEYMQKLISFRALLAAAPEGSEEDSWFHKLSEYSRILFLQHKDFFGPNTVSFPTRHSILAGRRSY